MASGARYQLQGLQVSCQSQEPMLSRLFDTLCAHPATCRTILRRKPHPSGACVDLNKRHKAFDKQHWSEVWRGRPRLRALVADRLLLCRVQSLMQIIFTGL